jgi:hypothetical protein
MSDFDQFLRESLGPEQRDPDRRFVARVQAQVRLDAQLSARKRAIGRRLLRDLVGIAAIAAGFVVLAESPAVTELATHSPEILVAGLLVSFGFVVALFSNSGRPGPFAAD